MVTQFTVEKITLSKYSNTLWGITGKGLENAFMQLKSPHKVYKSPVKVPSKDPEYHFKSPRRVPKWPFNTSPLLRAPKSPLGAF